MVFTLNKIFILGAFLLLFHGSVTDASEGNRKEKTFKGDLGHGPPWRILFFGSDSFSVKTLEKLVEAYESRKLITKLEVVTTKGSAVVPPATRKWNLTTYEWPLQQDLVQGQYDVGVLVSFGHLIPKSLIDSFPLGILNAHPSLLPRWRGASPIPYAIMNGDKETGVTIIKLKPDKFDEGNIVCQTKRNIDPDDTTTSLQAKLAEDAAHLLMKVIKGLPESAKSTKLQEANGVTLAPKLTAATARIVWWSMTSDEIYNRHRALQDIYPLETVWQKYHVKLHGITPFDATENVQIKDGLSKVENLAGNSGKHRSNVMGVVENYVAFGATLKPGLVMYDKKNRFLRVMCCDGAQLIVRSVTVVGKKTMDATSFFNGFMTRVKNGDKRFGEFENAANA